MMSRHEDEQRARKERLMLELEWDEQRKLEEQLRQARQKQKQSEIWENYKAKDAKQVITSFLSTHSGSQPWRRFEGVTRSLLSPAPSWTRVKIGLARVTPSNRLHADYQSGDQ